ncbi:hypothetical protein HS125_17640 [bacterium]|nr:hypothetical protein [bacterium]
MMDAASASAWTMLGLALGLLALPRLAEAEGAALSEATRLSNARMMAEYFEEMCIPKPFDPRRGEEIQKHRDAIRARLLADLGLSPLPERVPLDLRYSEPLEHEWASVRRVYYQLWPGVYAHGLLYMPKAFREKPAPAMLCPAGHFPDSNLYKGEQARALFRAAQVRGLRPFQSHYEVMSLGVSQQTLLVWQNMRAIDLLCSLPEVDDARIGSAGCSGGGYQTAMMLALEPRVVVGSDVGYSEEYRSILFPQTSHCVCNHIPNVMRYTDQTEISCLGMPKPIQYMVMNDQTKFFPYSHYPIVQDLFRVNGASGRTDVAYFDTPHDYARPKRERTYWWMEKWLRGVESSRFPEEPATLEDEGTFPVRAFDKLMLSFPENKGWRAISDYYRERYLFKAPEIAARADWEAYRARMRAALADLLGEAAQLPSRNEKPKGRGGEESPPAPLVKGGAEEVVEVRFPSEGGLMLPASVVLPRKTGRRAPIVLMVSGDGRDWLLAGEGPGSPRALAREGNLVVVLDTRFIGELDWRHYERLFATKEEGERILTYEHIRYLNAVSPRAWERNSIVWGRPIAGMMATDLIRTLDGVLKHLGSAGADGVDGGDVTVITRDSADLAVAALFAAALDERIRRVDADLADACFAKTETFGGWWLPPGYDPSVRPANGLSMVPFILRHGDVLQWAALSADRQMVLRNLPAEAGDAGWLSGVFAAVGNARGVTIEKTVPLTGEMIHVKSERDGSLAYSWTPGAAPAKAPKVVPFRGGWGLKFDAGRQNELILFSPPLTRGEEGETTAPPLMTGGGGDSSRFWKTRGPLTLQMVVRPEKLVVAEAALFSKWIATDGKRAVFWG